MSRSSERPHDAAEVVGDDDASDGVIVEEEVIAGAGDA
jgi:hypothetical protein